MVEHQLPKLAAWVRFPSPAPNDKKGGMLPFIFVSAHVAQQAERRLGKAEVAGSSPVVGSSFEGAGKKFGRRNDAEKINRKLP